MDVILGTAGHIDHGKTSLVRALTGINCDRLDEEKRRGITIELGFAWLDLPDGRRLGIVDVPGHERFVKNMVAGAAGIDCMILVVAADEGIMPQTREHLDICTLLGVRSGLIVLTKTDMVEPSWLEMVQEDVRENLAGTFLADAPMLAVSSATGEGIDSLRKAIADLVAALPAKDATDIMRLPVDRVFTLKGFGTIVTGTLVSGDCAQGEELTMVPSGKLVRARTLQVHGQQVKKARQGQRCAINLLGADVEDIQRGDVVARPGTLFPSRRWVVWLTCLPSAPHPIRQRLEIHFHHGSRECPARILFRDRSELAPGDSALAELHFPEPVAGVFGDHFVLRAHSPLRTIAGGTVLDPLPPVLRSRDPQFVHKLGIYKSLAEIGQNSVPEQGYALVKDTLQLRNMPGADEARLMVLTGLSSENLRGILTRLQEDGDALCWDAAGRQWIAKPAFENALASCVERITILHKREPLKTSFAQAALLAGWGDELPQRFIQRVIEEGIRRGLLKQEGNGIKLAAYEAAPDKTQSELIDRILSIYGSSPFTPPALKELCEELGMEPKNILTILAHLSETGRVTKIKEGLYFQTQALEQILERVRSWYKEHESLDVGDMKTMFDISRKYAIPLLEYMDSIKMTCRDGNLRRLAR